MLIAAARGSSPYDFHNVQSLIQHAIDARFKQRALMTGTRQDHNSYACETLLPRRCF